MKLKCFLFNHKLDANDGGYGVCSRCNYHEYYNYDSYGITIPNIYWIIRNYLRTNIKSIKTFIYDKCNDCKKPYSIFGIKTWFKHNNCLPF